MYDIEYNLSRLDNDDDDVAPRARGVKSVFVLCVLYDPIAHQNN